MGFFSWCEELVKNDIVESFNNIMADADGVDRITRTAMIEAVISDTGFKREIVTETVNAIFDELETSSRS